MRYEPSTRLLRLALALAGTRAGLTVDEMRGTVDPDGRVSRRTVERLLVSLRALFPALEEAAPGETPKRWRLADTALSPLATIGADHLADLAGAAALLDGDGRSAAAGRLRDLGRALQSALSPDRRRRLEADVEALTEAEGVACRPGPRVMIDPAVLAPLREAVLACRPVRFRYRSRASGRRRWHLVHPYGFLYGVRHYLVAVNAASGAVRHWALGHIEAIEPQDGAFVPDPAFRLEDHAGTMFGVFHEAPFDVAWRFAPAVAGAVRTYRFHPRQTVEDQTDGAVVVRFRAGGALEMAWHLHSWGEHVEVLGPPDFWDRVAAQRANYRG